MKTEKSLSRWRIACCSVLLLLFQSIVWIGMHDGKDMTGMAALSIASLAIAWMYLLDDVRTLVPAGRKRDTAIQVVNWTLVAILTILVVVDTAIKFSRIKTG